MEERERILKYQFDYYCKKVIKRTACRLLKIYKNRLEHELSIDSLLNFNCDSHTFNYEGEELLEELLKLDKCSIEIDNRKKHKVKLMYRPPKVRP